jgi:hypothetical protein
MLHLKRLLPLYDEKKPDLGWNKKHSRPDVFPAISLKTRFKLTPQFRAFPKL